VVKRWLEDFSMTFFGFTLLVESFRPDQVEALLSIDQNRLLLESDSPYFAPRGVQVSSPNLLCYAAEAL
jgi:Tat protein secretion system quality control protein TatD with DNase activity